MGRNADDTVIRPQAIPISLSAMPWCGETIEKLVTWLEKAHYEVERDHWSAMAKTETRVNSSSKASERGLRK